MRIDRRKFLKLAGLAGVGLGFSTADLLLKGDAVASSSHSKAMAKERLAMVIDIRKFRTEDDYRRVINACHSIHNVPTLIAERNNPKNEVKWIWTDRYERTFPDQKDEFHPEALKEKNFLLLCNHCDNPPCVRVCPTKATFKSRNGIVAQDPHRCIGCRFCMAACPFGARSFNWVDPGPYIEKTDPTYPKRTMGVVEKCTFCVERLAKGLGPACAEESNGGMVFGNLSDPDSEVRRLLASNYAIRRKPSLGTLPSVFYIIGGDENAG